MIRAVVAVGQGDRERTDAGGGGMRPGGQLVELLEALAEDGQLVARESFRSRQGPPPCTVDWRYIIFGV